MAPTRRKAAAQDAPQSIEEATALAARYSSIITANEHTRAEADAMIAQIEAVRDGIITPLDEEAKAIFLRMRAWWSVEGAALTDGKRKSVELAGCVLGERTPPPSLQLVKMKTPEAIWMIHNEVLGQDDPDARSRWQALIRTKYELDKPAILKALLGRMGERLVALGFKSKQKEEFFIDRAAAKPAAVEEVADPAAQEQVA